MYIWNTQGGPEVSHMFPKLIKKKKINKVLYEDEVSTKLLVMM